MNKRVEEFIVADSSPVNIGDSYNDWPNAKIVEIYYSNENKKWFEFWKRKEQQGYLVRWEE